MTVALITVVRPHICLNNAEEIASSACRYGCKVFRCAKCHCTAVVHNPTYGCREDR